MVELALDTRSHGAKAGAFFFTHEAVEAPPSCSSSCQQRVLHPSFLFIVPVSLLRIVVAAGSLQGSHRLTLESGVLLSRASLRLKNHIFREGCQPPVLSSQHHYLQVGFSQITESEGKLAKQSELQGEGRKHHSASISSWESSLTNFHSMLR